MSVMPFYIYRHIRPDKNEVFYIGKGCWFSKGHSNRAYDKKSRNKWWKRVVEKNGGNYEVEIIYECFTQEEVNKKEIEFIALYGKKCNGGTLVNMTDGGDGSLGVKLSEEAKKKLSERWSGENHPNWGKRLSKETCMKKSESMKMSDKNLRGKKLPDWWKDRIRKTKFGVNNPMYGKKSHLAKKVIDTSTGIIYDSIQEAAKSTPYQFQYISAMLNGVKRNKTTLKFYNG